MTISIQIQHKDVSTICEPILRSVPEWFGIEEANQNYLAFVDNNLTFIAYEDDVAVGFLSVNQHFPQSAEIHVMIVHRDHHRKGIGRQLVQVAEDRLRQSDTHFLQVKTLSDKHPDEGYKLTRTFYKSIGFVPLEEFPTIWGEANPALQLIKAL
ncbi:MAG: GNAT family N-acetyltransferase [Chloroflexota bacterium]